MEPAHQTNVAAPSPDEDKFKKGDGSLKLRTIRPRSRTGSGGILRVDVNKSTFISTDFRQTEPSSPQPSVDRLSVTFATEERSICSSDASVKLNFYVPPSTPPISCMEKVRFPTITDGEDDTEEDYSASVTAIMQRRASTRKSRRKSRRTSSPFSHDQDGLQVRRRSSCFTTSSGDTAISMDESLPQEVTQEQIFENIRLHKEVLSSVKMQPWIMKRKLKLVQQAKSYIKRHQGALQERLAQSRSTRDILARWNIYLVQKLQHFRRELANLSNLLIPWESRIKEIESHFGSVVASYFTFLRWLFWVNLIISVVLVAFVAIPELLTADPNSAGGRKVILPEEKGKATNLFTLWDFEGVLKYSPLFYGYYTDKNGTGKGYRLPLAYFMTGLGVYVYSFVATLRKMAENSRMSKLSEKDDECVFSWKLFTGWDYMIGNAETAQNRVASIILGFKEALLEEAEKKREPRNWKVIGARVLVNLMVLGLLAISAYAVVEVVQRSTHKDAGKSFWRRNEITVVMSLISFLFPMFFEGLGYFEHYHPRKQLRLQLARIMVLNMLNLYSLIFALFDKIRDMTRELQTFKNTSHYEETVTQASIEYVPDTCFEIYEDCQNVTTYPELSSASLISVLGNISMGLILTNLNQTQKFPKIFNTTLQNITNLTNITNDSFSFPYFNDTMENFINNLNVSENLNLILDETYESMDYNNSFAGNDANFTNSNISIINSTEYLSKNLTTNNYGNYNYAEEDYFDFESDYATLDSRNNYDIDKNNSTEDENITSTTEYDARSNLTTDEIVTTLLPLLNITFDTDVSDEYSTLKSILNETLTNLYQNFLNENNSTEDENITSITMYDAINNLTTDEIVTTLLPLLNITFDTDASGEYSTLKSILNETLTKLYQNVSNEPKPQCKIQKCFPVKVSTPEPIANLTPLEKEQQMKLDYKQRKRLRKLCWETMFGQELVKLTVMDLSFTIISILAVDFVRAIFVRVMNNFWCWDLEKKFPQYGDFKIAENILHLVNNQGMVWMGMFFSPGITVINLIKLAILMYLRSWAVLTCNVPHEVVFRASRSNNFYLALLLTMLFLCVLPVGYAIVWIEPSWHCGPFSNYNRIYHIFTKSLKQALPKALHQTLDYIASPFIVIPLLVLLILIIYYMISLTNALREANNDLKLQLRRERTEERRKMFQIADKRRRNGSGDSGDDTTPFGKWKKLLPNLPNSKSFDADTSGKDNDIPAQKDDGIKNKDFLAKFIKRAIKNKPQVAETNNAPPADDATDTEQHDSLPDDINTRDTKSEDETRVLNNFRKLLNAKAKQNKEKSVKNEKDSVNKSKSVPSNSHKTKPMNKTNTVPAAEKIKSISISSSSKDLRQDSLTSNWSDNIPVIKISGTGSSECILETQNETSSTKKTKHNKPRKMIHQSHIDIDTKSDDVPGSDLQIAEPQCPATNSSSETLITVKIEELETLIEQEQELNNLATPDDNCQNDIIKPKEKASVDTEQSIDMQKSTSNSNTSMLTKTESSTDYKE